MRRGCLFIKEKMHKEMVSLYACYDTMEKCPVMKADELFVDPAPKNVSQVRGAATCNKSQSYFAAACTSQYSCASAVS